jgi:hypothetical protein
MVTSINSSTNSVSTQPLSVRAESAASILSNSGASNQTSDPAIDVAEVVKIFRYNSFEFVYKQDFGKIVLLRQEPQTGNEIAQFPSEYYLQQYAATARAQRIAVLTGNRAQENTPLEPAENDGPSSQLDTVTTPAAATSPPPAPSPAVRVDIRV